jgi:tripartite-type tricarboxylate transporter receptor subunit TctC
MQTRRALAAGGLAALLAPRAARAAWPDRPIRLVVPFAPGGSQDIVARLLARALTEALGQNVVVENRPGAGGNMGYELVARERPDGYTLLAGADPLSINPLLFPRVGFDPVRDFAPVVEAVRVPQMLAVRAASPHADLDALLQAGRQARLPVGTGGNGSLAHLVLVRLADVTGTQIVHIPYRGGAPAVGDLLSGILAGAMVNIGAGADLARAGTLRALAVTGARRSTGLPDVPTVGECGLSELTAEGWHGIVAPAGMNPVIVARLNRAVRDALRDRWLRERLVGLGLEPVDEPPAALGARIAGDAARWAPVVRALAIQAD